MRKIFGYSCDKVLKVVMLGKRNSGAFVHSRYHLVSFVQKAVCMEGRLHIHLKMGKYIHIYISVSSVQSLSHVRPFATP